MWRRRWSRIDDDGVVRDRREFRPGSPTREPRRRGKAQAASTHTATRCRPDRASSRRRRRSACHITAQRYVIEPRLGQGSRRLGFSVSRCDRIGRRAARNCTERRRASRGAASDRDPLRWTICVVTAALIFHHGGSCDGSAGKSTERGRSRRGSPAKFRTNAPGRPGGVSCATGRLPGRIWSFGRRGRPAEIGAGSVVVGGAATAEPDIVSVPAPILAAVRVPSGVKQKMPESITGARDAELDSTE